MKARLVITDPKWIYQLHGAPQLPGKYFVTLRSHTGFKLVPAGPAIGPFPTLDFIQENAERLYRRLVEMRRSQQFPAASARDNSQITKTTVTACQSSAPLGQEFSGLTGLDKYAE